MRKAIVLTALALLTLGAKSVVKPPATPKHPVTETYFGVKVTDPYRWLENASDPAVQKWVDAQNRYSRAVLDSLPHRADIRKRLTEILTDRPASYYGLQWIGGRLFAMKNQPPKEEPMLVTLASIDDKASERVLVDPNAMGAKGSMSVDFFVPSLDGKLVTVSLSRGGSENGDVHVVDVATGKETGEVVPHVNGGTAGGSVAWNADGSGFWYTRYPHEGERPKEDLAFYQQVWFHKLGTPLTEDRYELGKDFPKIAETVLETSRDGRYVLATVANGDGGDAEHFLHGDNGWQQITAFADGIRSAEFGFDDNIYLLSRKNAPMGAILRVPRGTPALTSAQTIVPASGTSIEWFVPAPHHLYVNYIAGGPSELRQFSLDGAAEGAVPILPVSSVGGVVPLEGDTIALLNGSYLEPANWFTFDPADGKTKDTALKVKPRVSFEDAVVDRVMATSKDGTQVPLNIIRLKSAKLDGANKTLLTGYGGFDISMKPSFNLSRRVWLDHGGVYAIANLRGGGEFGERWHEQGKLTNKQNVFDDFAACARYLIDHKYTSRAKLAIEGGSNGGLLMGAALTQHPELYRAVVSHVGIYDMLRFERFPNGVFNVTEYGTIKDPVQFKALLAYSPYQHVVDGMKYPAVLMMTGANDPRVDPANSRKMAARLQAANASKNPILLVASTGRGHGVTALSQVIDEQTDVDAFLLHELGG